MASQEEATQSVELSGRIVDRVEDRLPRTEFDSTGEYVEFVLEEVLARVEAETADDEDVETADEAEVKERLESLGYLQE